MDPVTVIATATAAYNALRKGIAIGRELQDMGSQLTTWAGAISDIDFLAKKAENPPWWKVGGSVQAEAIELFAAKKKAEQQRAELKQFIQYSYGQSAWEELLRIEGQVRKQRAASDYRKAEAKETMVTIAIVLLMMAAGIGGLIAFVMFLMAQEAR